MTSVAGAPPTLPTASATLPGLLAYTEALGLERYLRRPKRGVASLTLALLWLVLAWRGRGAPAHPPPPAARPTSPGWTTRCWSPSSARSGCRARGHSCAASVTSPPAPSAPPWRRATGRSCPGGRGGSGRRWTPISCPIGDGGR